MDGMEQISFKMIAAIGEAKTMIMQAIAQAGEQDFEGAAKKLDESRDKLAIAHKAHFSLIQKEASGEQVELGLLFIHAEDQLMTTSLLKDVAEQLVKMYEKMYALI